MSQELGIRLGVEAKDLSSGLIGFLIYQNWDIAGNIRFGLQPQSLDGKVSPDPVEVDFHMLEYVGAGVSARVTPPPATPKFPLGSRAREIPSGIEGVLIRMTLHLNGCIYYTLAAKATKEEPKGLSLYTPETFLEKASTPAQEKPDLLPKKPVQESASKGPGGPMTAAIAYNKAQRF